MVNGNYDIRVFECSGARPRLSVLEYARFARQVGAFRQQNDKGQSAQNPEQVREGDREHRMAYVWIALIVADPVTVVNTGMSFWPCKRLDQDISFCLNR